jgi:hypothetical protein
LKEMPPRVMRRPNTAEWAQSVKDMAGCDELGKAALRQLDGLIDALNKATR